MYTCSCLQQDYIYKLLNCTLPRFMHTVRCTIYIAIFICVSAICFVVYAAHSRRMPQCEMHESVLYAVGHNLLCTLDNLFSVTYLHLLCACSCSRTIYTICIHFPLCIYILSGILQLYIHPCQCNINYTIWFALYSLCSWQKDAKIQ